MGIEFHGDLIPDKEKESEEPNAQSRSLITVHESWAEVANVTGDLIEIEIGGIGTLKNHVVAEE